MILMIFWENLVLNDRPTLISTPKMMLTRHILETRLIDIYLFAYDGRICPFLDFWNSHKLITPYKELSVYGSSKSPKMGKFYHHGCQLHHRGNSLLANHHRGNRNGSHLGVGDNIGDRQSKHT